jgi:hypothetical protein
MNFTILFGDFPQKRFLRLNPFTNNFRRHNRLSLSVVRTRTFTHISWPPSPPLLFGAFLRRLIMTWLWQRRLFGRILYAWLKERIGLFTFDSFFLINIEQHCIWASAQHVIGLNDRCCSDLVAPVPGLYNCMRLVVAGLVNCYIMSDICLCSSCIRCETWAVCMCLFWDDPRTFPKHVERGMVCINLDEDVWSSVFNYIFRIKNGFFGFIKETLNCSQNHFERFWKNLTILGLIVVMKKK